MEPDDLRLMHEWLQRPHVRRWWTDRHTYEEVEQHYLPAIEGEKPTDMYIAPRVDELTARLARPRSAGHTIVPVIEQVADGAVGAEVAEAVMRALPQWFGLEESLLDYVEAARTLPTFIANEDSANVGFLTLKQHTPQAAEILAMGVIPKWHRRGIGRALVEAATHYALSGGARLLQVKTLGPSHHSENYARTRAFYESLGFIPMEETTALWGAANPCLFMVKPLT